MSKLQYLLDSAEKYYNYCKSNNKSRTKIHVKEIIKKQKYYMLYLYETHINEAYFNADNLIYNIYNKDYYSNDITTIKYDNRRKILTVEPREELESIFEALLPGNITIESSLLFLIENLVNWLKNSKSHFLEPISTCHKVEPIKADISETQASAVCQLLEYEMSYVWGAPGTGKTQSVLSTAIISYIRSNQNVLILAPTNNSLEQVLRGLFNQFQKHNIPIEKVIRLGVPTSYFFEQYPTVCENGYVEKLTAEYKQKIERNNKQIELFKQHSNLEELNNQVLDIYNEAKNGYEFEKHIKQCEINVSLCENQLQKAKNLLEQGKSDLRACESKLLPRREYITQINRIDDRIRILSSDISHEENKANGILSHIFQPVKRKHQDYAEYYRNELNELKIKKSEIESEREKAENNVEIAKREIIRKNRNYNQQILNLKQAENELREVKEELSRYIQHINKKLHNAINGFPEAYMEKFSVINHPDNLKNLIISIESVVEECESILNDSSIELKAYGITKTEEELLLENEQYKDKINSKSSASTEQRLQRVNVIACTVDKFISKFYEWYTLGNDYCLANRISHIFLDEAAYLPIIKAIPIFSFGKRVTLLGDHMQLPPVCEYNFTNKNVDEEYLFLWSQSAIYIEDVICHRDFEVAYKKFVERSEPDFSRLKLIYLNTTYRFSDNLSNILSEYIYKKELISKGKETQILYINAPHAIPPNKNRTSDDEAEAIKSYIDGHETEDIVVLAPYNNQVELIRDKLSNKYKQRIMTVHKSQGREWNTVILSVTDTTNYFLVNSHMPIGKRLLNTALSRAKEKLIIVCDGYFWKSDEMKKRDQLITKLIRNSEEITK